MTEWRPALQKTAARLEQEYREGLRFWQQAFDEAARSRTIAGRLWGSRTGTAKPAPQRQSPQRDSLASRIYPHLSKEK